MTALPEENVVDPILAHAVATPGQVAIDGDRDALTYGGLAGRMAAFAAGLDAAGLSPGAVVALSTRDPAAMLVALCGAMLGGYAPIQLDPESPAAEARRLFDLAGAALLVGLSPGEEAALPATPVADILAAGAGAAPGAMRRPGGARAAQINLSSGTTGLRKAVPLAHVQQLGRSRTVMAALGQGPADRHLPVMALHFAFARQAAMRTLLSGGTVVTRRMPADIEGFLALMERERITQLEATPGHMRFLLGRLPMGDAPLMPGVRCLAVSTALLGPEERRTVRRRLTPNLYITYGSNEMGVAACARPADLDREPATLGRALPGCEIVVVDETGRALPPGGIGEIRVRTANAASRYIGDADASGRSFRDGWFLTGDAGRLDGDGLLFLTGRLDDRINFGGIKIYPGEIEDVLRGHDDVAEAAVVGVPSPRFQQMPVAAVIGRRPVDPAVLLAHCARHLGNARRPLHVLVVDALPQTGSGKVDRPALLRLVTEMLRPRPS